MNVLFENIQFFSALLLLATFVLYLSTGINLIFVNLMLLNPYIAALICFSKICLNYYNFKRFRLRKDKVFIFLVLIVFLIIPYFFSTFNLRTMTQLVQFLLMSFILIVLMNPEEPIIKKPTLLLQNIRYSCLLVSLVKIVSVYTGNVDFFMFGKNEDAMLIVLGGVGSSLYFFLREQKLSTLIDFIIYCYVVSLYESRSALFFTFLVPFIIIFATVYGNKYRLLNKIYLFLLFFIFLITSIYSLEIIISSFGLDQANNYSNLERFGMYFFTFDFIVSENFTGVGIGNLDLVMESMYLKKYVLDIYPHPHSSLLRFALELGFFGLLIYVSFIFYLLKVSFSTLVEDEDKVVGTLMLFFTSWVIYFSLFDSIFYSFFRGVFTLLILSAFISLRCRGTKLV